MAHLKRWQRKNKNTGKMGTYWSIRDKKAARPNIALGFMSERQAKKLLRNYEAAKTLGKLPAVGPRPTSSGSTPSQKAKVPTLREWWGDVVSSDQSWPPSRMYDFHVAKGKRPGSKALRNVNDSRKVIVRDLGDLRLDQVTRAVGDRFVAVLQTTPSKRTGEPLSSRTIILRVGHLQESLKVAHEEGVIKALVKLNKPSLKRKKAVVWHTPEQARVLARVVLERREVGCIDMESTTLILTGLVVGMRKNEMLTRRWENLDWQRMVLSIAEQKLADGSWWRPKKEASIRDVALPGDLARLYQELWLSQGRPATGWIFPSPRDGRKPRGCFRRALKNTCITAGLPVLTPHQLRHTAATGLAFAGGTVKDLMAMGGWASAQIPNEIYTHTTADRVRDMVAKADPMAGLGFGAETSGATGRGYSTNNSQEQGGQK